ncbi:MAG TPA: YciI family protein [Kribbellaceae bacterium]|nr:YciI family protein [Kribbellaceae bacterium]
MPTRCPIEAKLTRLRPWTGTGAPEKLSGPLLNPAGPVRREVREQTPIRGGPDGPVRNLDLLTGAGRPDGHHAGLSGVARPVPGAGRGAGRPDRHGVRVATQHHATAIRGDVVTDGPFVEAKEVVAGFFVLEAPDLDVALRIAKLNPATRDGGVEVRPLFVPPAE